MKLIQYENAVSWRNTCQSQTGRQHKVVKTQYMDLAKFMSGESEKDSMVECYAVVLNVLRGKTLTI